MEDSILLTIQERLGGYYNGNSSDFDPDVLTAINTAISVLTQLGVGPTEGFRITGPYETWDQFITNVSPTRLEMIKDYIYLRVKLIFDPPQVGGVLNAYKETIDELTWRINVAVDPDHA